MESPFKNYSDMDISAMVDGMEAGILDFTFDDLKEVQSELVNRHMSSRYMAIVSSLMSDIIESGQIDEGKSTDDEKVFESSLSLLLNKSKEQSAKEEKKAPQKAPPIPAARKVDSKSSKQDKGPKKVDIKENKIEEKETPIKTIPVETIKISPVQVKPTPAEIEAKAKEVLFGNFNPAPTIQESKKAKKNEYPVIKFLSVYLKVVAWILIVLTLCGAAYAIFEYFYDRVDYSIYIGAGALFVAAHLYIIFYSIAENMKWKVNVAKLIKKQQHHHRSK